MVILNPFFSIVPLDTTIQYNSLQPTVYLKYNRQIFYPSAVTLVWVLFLSLAFCFKIFFITSEPYKFYCVLCMAWGWVWVLRIDLPLLHTTKPALALSCCLHTYLTYILAYVILNFLYSTCIHLEDLGTEY